MRPLRPTRLPSPVVRVLLVAGLALAAASCRSSGDWPRRFDAPTGSFVVYEPQPEQMSGDELTGRMAFSLRKPNEPEPTFGVIWFQAHVDVDRDGRRVTMRDLDVTLVRMPGLAATDARRFETLVETEARRWDLSGSLRALQAGLAASAVERASTEGLDNRPPRIVLVYRPSLLLAFDGTPVLEPIEGTRLRRVSNTPYAVVYDPDRATYHLAGADLWYAARDPLGPWAVEPEPPADVAAAVPPDTSAGDRARGSAPDVVTATEPTELIAFDGEPLLEPLVGTRLFYATNTESDVLRDNVTGTVWVLLSGRWYSAQSDRGPWTYVPADQLPDVFRQIPPDSPRGNLLASVAGTDPADEALADDEIPQTSAIRRDDHDADITWDGDPYFESIPGTGLAYGVNTDAEVLFDGRDYYLCDQGVWYVADDPLGPWSVSLVVPAGLDELPPTCPVYNLRWVEIYDVTPTVVYVGYRPGYLGHYACNGTVVYGTGYRYKAWRGPHRCYPRIATWGFHARYNPWLGRWSFGTSYGAGFLRVGTRWHAWRGARHHRGDGSWFGPGGYHRPWLAQDLTLLRTPPAPRYRPDARTPISLYNRPDNTPRVVRFKNASDPRVLPMPARRAPLPNDVFAGQDGKVYRRGSDGQWTVNDGGRWIPTKLPALAPPAPGGRGDVTRTPRPTPTLLPLPTPVTPPAAGDPGAAKPVVRPQPQPAPIQPATPEEPVRRVPPARQPERPAPPTPAPTPGGLEREYQAREREKQKPPAEPAPGLTPVRPLPAERRKPEPEQKPEPKQKPEPRQKPDGQAKRVP